METLDKIFLILHIFEYMFEFMTAFLFYIIVFKAKKNRILPFAAGAFAYAGAFMLSLCVENVIFDISANLILIFLMGMLFFESKIKRSALTAIFLCAALVISKAVCTLLMSSLDSDGQYIVSLSGVLLFKAIPLTVYFITVLSVGALLSKGYNKNQTGFLLLFPIMPLTVLFTLYIISSANIAFSGGMRLLIMAAGIAVTLSTVFIYLFYIKTTRELGQLYKSRSENERISADTTYYSILDRQNERLKAILHDEKNHLSAIKSLADKEEVSTYIDSIYGQIIENSLFGNTGNKMLDLTVNKYQYICDTEGIDLYVSIKTANLSSLESADLITLLGNILDNAVDAAKKSENKRIDFSINRVNRFDVVTCLNSCDTKPTSVKGEPITTKSGCLHGLGIKSIKRIVKKYNGNFEWSYDEENGEFSVYIAF